MDAIRDAVEADLPGVVALLADDPLGAGRERPGEPLHPSYAAAFRAMARQVGNRLVVADRDGVVVGCLQIIVIPGISHCGMTRAEIEGVRVAAALRGQGIGAALMRHAIKLAEAAGCGLMQLTSNRVRADAQRFYVRLGFVPSHVGMKLPLAPSCAPADLDDRFAAGVQPSVTA